MRHGFGGRSAGLCLLTVPLLLIELLYIMNLPADQLASRGFILDLAAVAMSVALTGEPLNEAYRYVACLLSVQL